MSRFRAIAFGILFGCLCLAVVARMADAQYTSSSGASGPGFSSGTLIQANGGTGISIGCGTPSATCGPCQLGGCYYWNSDVGVVLDGGSPFTWTDICQGVVTAPITVSPTYTTNCVGTHACMTYTKSGPMAMNQPDAAAFPSIAAPFTYGVTFAGVGSLTTNTLELDFGPTQGLIGVTHTSTGALQCTGSSPLSAGAPYANTFLAQLLCTQSTGLTPMFGLDVTAAGGSGVTSGGASTHVPGGGLTIGNAFNGQDANGGADGKILDVIVCTRDLTPLERTGYKSWLSGYLGGI